MLLKRMGRIFAALLFASFFWGTLSHAEAALLMEEPYGFFGTLNPTGHNAIYLEDVCAETPTHLRRCQPGETGVVISRYDGVNNYDWVAIPLIPYLYSVEEIADIPTVVNRAQVDHFREKYREAHFEPIGLDKSGGSYVRDGWKQLVGASYERRIYAFRFKTTPEQDDALIEQLNSRPNVSHFHLVTRNCSDFARDILNTYFPKSFHRNIFPDAGITTPKQITSYFVRYAGKHPDLQMAVFQIPQIPGYRSHSHSNKSIAESFSTTIYVVPLTLINPYLAGAIFVDYLFRGRLRVLPKNPVILSPETLIALTAPPQPVENSAGAEPQVSGTAPDLDSSSPSPRSQTTLGAQLGLKESLNSQ